MPKDTVEKKPTEKKQAEKKTAEKKTAAEKVVETKSVEKKTTTKKSVEKKEETQVEEYITRPALLKDFNVLIGEVVTEESQILTQTQNALVFAVNKKANKLEIKSAIEALFHAKVKSVNTMNKTGKKKRVGRFEGKLPDYKKAIVRFDSSFDLGKISQAVASEERKANPTESK